MTLPAVRHGIDDTGLTQQSQVPAHSRPADGVLGREVDHPEVAGGKPGNEIPAYRIGESLERVHTNR